MGAEWRRQAKHEQALIHCSLFLSMDMIGQNPSTSCNDGLHKRKQCGPKSTHFFPMLLSLVYFIIATGNKMGTQTDLSLQPPNAAYSLYSWL